MSESERAPRAEAQGDGEPENQREIEDASGGAAFAGGEHGDTASTRAAGGADDGGPEAVRPPVRPR